MTSRERVLAAINHREPDRVPLDIGGSRVSGIHVKAYQNLRDHLGLRGDPPRIYDLMQMLALVDPDVMDRLGLDVLPLHRQDVVWGLGTENWQPWQLWDGTPVQAPLGFDPVVEPDGSLSIYEGGRRAARMPRGGAFFDAAPEAIAAKVPVEQYHPPLLTDEELTWMQARARELYQGTDKALLGGLYLGNLLEMYLGGYHEWMITLLREPEYVHAIMDKTADNWIANLKLYNEAVGDYVFAAVFCDDLGMQNGQLVSCELFADRVAPYYKRIFGWLHEHTAMKSFFHSCGSIRGLLPQLVDMGVDILNPVQCTAAHMDPVELKAEYGDKLTFWGGGIDSQNVLPFGTPEEVRAQTQERLEVFSPGGGFVFNTTHNILPEVPPENLVAMVETVLAFR